MLSGTMRRSHLLLLASLQLCSARQPGFSIHDDMLAYPQVRVLGPNHHLLLVSCAKANTSTDKLGR